MKKKNFLVLFMAVLMTICSSLSGMIFAAASEEDAENEMTILTSDSAEPHFWWGYGSSLKDLGRTSLCRYLIRGYTIDTFEIDKSLYPAVKYKIVLKSKVSAERISVTIPQDYGERYLKECCACAERFKPCFEYLYNKIRFRAGGKEPDSDEFRKMGSSILKNGELNSVLIESWVNYCYDKMISEKDVVKRDGMIGRGYSIDTLDWNPLEEFEHGAVSWEECFRAWCDEYRDFCSWRADCAVGKYGVYWGWNEGLSYDPFCLFHENKTGISEMGKYVSQITYRLKKVEKQCPQFLLPLCKASFNVVKGIFLNYVRYYEGCFLIPCTFGITQKTISRYLYVQHSVSKLNLFLLCEMIDKIAEDAARRDYEFSKEEWCELLEHTNDFAEALSYKENIQIY